MRVRRAVLALVAAVALPLAACGGADTGSSTSASADGDGANGSPVDLSFTVPTVDGGEFDGTSLAGEPAVLWFWAPWCATCAGESSQVSALADAYRGQATVVGVAGLDDSRQSMRDFVDRTGIDNFPQLADPDGTVWQRFEIATQSQFVILDAHGAVDARGELDPDDIPDRLDQLVA